MLTGGTDVHLVMVDLRNSEMDGQQGEDLLAACGITINRNTVPFDPRPASVASGLRSARPPWPPAASDRRNTRRWPTSSAPRSPPARPPT